MKSHATTIEEYLASLPEERRIAIQAVRKVIKKNIDKDFKEGIQSGVLAYVLPHSKYPHGYHCDPKQPLPFAGIASQKNHIGLYLFCVYMNPGEVTRFRKEWLAAGKKLNMGKSCVRVKRLDDIALDALAGTFKRVTAKKFVATYEASLPESVKKKRAAMETATKKKASKAKATKKTASRKKA